MKKIFLLAVLVLAAATPLLLTSCSSDDDEASDNSIVGSWELTASDIPNFWAEYSSWKVGDVMTFADDGSYSLTSSHSYSEKGKWSLSEGELKLYDISSSDGATNLPSTVTCTISGDTMTLYLSVLDLTLHFKRK